jgi:hypothetical protein
MSKNKPPSKSTSEEYDRFERLARKIISVPKREIDKRQARYEKRQKSRKEKESWVICFEP